MARDARWLEEQLSIALELLWDARNQIKDYTTRGCAIERIEKFTEMHSNNKEF
jgi:hypothetical protein